MSRQRDQAVDDRRDLLLLVGLVTSRRPLEPLDQRGQALREPALADRTRRSTAERKVLRGERVHQQTLGPRPPDPRQHATGPHTLVEAERRPARFEFDGRGLAERDERRLGQLRECLVASDREQMPRGPGIVGEAEQGNQSEAQREGGRLEPLAEPFDERSSERKTDRISRSSAVAAPPSTRAIRPISPRAAASRAEGLGSASAFRRTGVA
ncbi:MAG: hypothetical protein R3E53_15705 [Myxococcota bacterium]